MASFCHNDHLLLVYSMSWVRGDTVAYAGTLTLSLHNGRYMANAEGELPGEVEVDAVCMAFTEAPKVSMRRIFPSNKEVLKM